MEIWNGTIKDRTDFASEEFLKVNSCGFQNIPKTFTVVRENGRRDYHFLLITSGKCEAIHGGKKHLLCAGNLVIYEPFEKQEYKFFENCSSLWCHFSGTAVKEIFENSNIKSGVYFTDCNQNLTDVFTSLVQKFNFKGSEKFATPCLLELIYKIGDSISNSKNIAEFSAGKSTLSTEFSNAYSNPFISG